MKRFLLTIILSLSFVGTSACQKNSDFLYYVKPNTVVSSHKIKELISGPKVDMLWITGGMTEHENDFYAGVTRFMTDFTQMAAIDWRMAVLSSDPNSQPFLGMGARGVFDSTSPNPIGKMTSAVSAALNSPDAEQIFEPIYTSLTQHPEFVRDDALLAIVMTNDASDASAKDLNAHIKTADQMLNFLKVKKGDLSKVIVYGVFGAIDLQCDKASIDEVWNYHGSPFEQVIDATGGQGLSLCANDFGTSLMQISSHLKKNIVQHPKIYLKTRPVMSTLKMTYHGTPLPGGPTSSGGFWTYDIVNNAIIFNDLSFAVNDTDSIELSYDEDIGINH